MNRIAAKLGISMLAVLLMTVGTVSADGGSSYSSAEQLVPDVPYGRLEIYGPYEFSGDDWWRFDANNGDEVYIDLDYQFAYYGGAMYLHDEYEGDIEAWVTYSNSRHRTTVVGNPQPRIEIEAGSEFTYSFVVGLNV